MISVPTKRSREKKGRRGGGGGEQMNQLSSTHCPSIFLPYTLPFTPTQALLASLWMKSLTGKGRGMLSRATLCPV